MIRTVHIDGRPIGPGHPPYVVAEMSGNHNGDLSRALKLIEAAHAAGTDAVKLQTYTADTITLDHDGPEFVLQSGLWAGRRLYDLYREAHTPWDWHAPLFAHARKLGITIFSAPFDPTAVDLLEGLDAPAYKIASLELVDLPLVARVAATGRPIIMSRGAAGLSDVEAAVATARAAGAEQIVLLHCVSGYPTPIAQANLATIPHLAQTFDCVAGFSDHTLGLVAPVAAVALGASMIEKHFTLARADGGPDCAFSLEADELAELVANCRAAWEAVGRVSYATAESEQENRKFRRSLYVTADVAKGEAFGPHNVRSIRPGWGLPPKHLPVVLGRPAARAVSRGTALDWSLVGSPE